MRAIRLVLLVLPLLVASRASAQVTTANLRGTVLSGDDRLPMAGTEVTLVHVPTGNSKTTLTNDDGGFAFTGLRVGGPYQVTAILEGFKPAELKEIYLSSGRTKDVELTLKLAEEVIEVQGSSVVRTTSGRTVITSQEMNELPSVSRDPRDFVRRAPEAVVNSDHSLSIGGANTRFNSITIDGIRQDDDFGLNNSGYPTRRSPIAVSAIEELTVESAPFDVRYGKFMGGNVNIVTKSGTNDIHGEVLGTYSSDALIGHQTLGDTLASTNFHEYRYGVALGGPIIEDKVHFFADIEGLSASTPVSQGPAGSTATNITSKVTQDEVAMAQQIAQSVYGFNAGDPSRNLDEGDLKLFAKVDWAINKENRLSVAYQRTGGNATSIPNPSSDSSLPLSSNWYNAQDTLQAFYVRLFTDWSEQLSTETEFNGKLVSSRVNPLNGNGFMQAQIRTPEGGTITMGPDDFRQTNLLDNNLLHGKVLANYLAGEHLLTLGVEYDRLFIDNLFIPDTNGAATYATLMDFMNKTPSQLAYSNSVTLNPSDAAANWSQGTTTAYAQDQFKVNDQLTITGGLRLEYYDAEKGIAENANFVTRNGFSNNATLNGRSILMPRLGASYLPTDHLNLRGGVGLYSGGTPTVWVSNNYTNDGVRTSSVFCPSGPTGLCPAAATPGLINGFDGRNVPSGIQALIQQGNGNVDALDPNFKIPSTWKAGTGLDYSFDLPGLEDIGKNVELKLNYVYSKVYHGVGWRDLRRCNLQVNPNSFACTNLPNNAPVGTLVDGRPLYDTVGFNQARGYDMLLTNDDRGYGHSASVSLQKGFPFGLFVSASYAYQNVMEANPANSSRSVSNYDFVAINGDPNNLQTAVSNYQRQHRLTAAIEFSRALVGDIVDDKPWKDMKTSIGLFFETRSGQPYSWTFGDASFGTTLAKIYGEDRTFASKDRELFYVPKSGDGDVILNGISQSDFDAFLSQTGLDKYRGQIAPRNAFTSPWISRMDVRLSQDLPNPLGHRARFMVDIENLGNMLDNRWGRSSSVPFPYFTPAVDITIDKATGNYVYSNLRNANPNRVDALSSVWRMSLGLMYDF